MTDQREVLGVCGKFLCEQSTEEDARVVLEAGPSQMCAARPASPRAPAPLRRERSCRAPHQGAPAARWDRARESRGPERPRESGGGRPAAPRGPRPPERGLRRSGGRRRREAPREDAAALGPGAPAAVPLGGRWIRERGQVRVCFSPGLSSSSGRPLSLVPPGTPRGCAR